MCAPGWTKTRNYTRGCTINTHLCAPGSTVTRRVDVNDGQFMRYTDNEFGADKHELKLKVCFPLCVRSLSTLTRSLMTHYMTTTLCIQVCFPYVSGLF